MALEIESLSITTIADGSATAYTVAVHNGFLHAIIYTPDGSVPYPDNVTVAVTGETSLVPIWSETIADGDAGLTRYPRGATHTVLGAAALYAGAGVAVLDRIPIEGERIKVVIGSGGNTKIGTFRFVVST